MKSVVLTGLVALVLISSRLHNAIVIILTWIIFDFLLEGLDKKFLINPFTNLLLASGGCLPTFPYIEIQCNAIVYGVLIDLKNAVPVAIINRLSYERKDCID